MTLEDRAELELVVREILTEILLGDTSPATRPKSPEWVPLKDAVEPLGYPSYDALLGAVAAGLFRIGKEVLDRRKAGSRKARYQINIERARKRLLEDPNKRRSI